jgi:phosphatidate cytidylyltransferase
MLSLYLYNLYIFNFEFGDLFSLIILVVLSAVLGDYFESFIKRKYFIKDSGSIIPGHGGILDRMDSAIVTLPIIILLFGYI